MRRRPPEPLEETVTLTVAVEVFGETISDDFEVPAGPTRPRRLLPIVRTLAEAIVDESVRRVEAQGRTVTCRAHCGACCRQLVPVSRTETYEIRDVIERLPAGRRETVEARFADARRRIDEAGLRDRLLHPSRSVEALALEYFSLGIPCPFLEDESCSIYEDRPVVCREYLVTSAAEHCAKPTKTTIDMVPVSGDLSHQICHMERPEPGSTWIPLSLAPEWAEAHPEEPPSRTGPELVARLLTPRPPREAGRPKGRKRR